MFPTVKFSNLYHGLNCFQVLTEFTDNTTDMGCVGYILKHCNSHPLNNHYRGTGIYVKFCYNFKGTVSVISSKPACKKGNLIISYEHKINVYNLQN